MIKKLFLIIVIIFFMNPGISCEKFQEQEYYRPSLGSACYQMATGLALHFTSGYGLNYFHENNNGIGEQISGFGRGVACQLMADGFFEFVHWSYHSTLNEWHWLIAQQEDRGLTAFLMSDVQDFRPQALQLQQEVLWNKGTTITRALTSIPFSVGFVAQSFMNRSALQYNSIFEHDLFVCGGIFSTGYYLCELYSVYNQKGLRQGDIPSMGALAGWFKIVAAPQAFTFFPIGSKWGRHTTFTLVFLGCAQVYSALAQTIRNARNLMKGRTTVTIINRPSKTLETAILKQTLLSLTTMKKPQIPSDWTNKRENNKTKRPKTIQSLVRENLLQMAIEEEEAKKNEIISTTFAKSSSQETYEYSKLKEKVKKKGVSNPPKSSDAHDKKSNSRTLDRFVTSRDVREKSKKIILGNINQLMTFNAVKEVKINKLLGDTCKIIDGKTKKIDGSEFAIVFDRGNSRISIKYETPHPASIYEGYKLKTVLNAMETSLMYGRDEQTIRDYMKQHNINRFYSIPKNLLSVLWTRPGI